MEYENMNSVDRSRTTQLCFTLSVIGAQALGLMAVVITGVWMGHYQGGFAWQSNPSKEFNYHPLFMVIGLVFLYGNAILVYRVFRNDNKKAVKILHAVLHILALLFASVGLKAVFDSHNLAQPHPVPNMYSLHSWVGIITVVLFGLQWVFGLVVFLIPGLSLSIRALYKPTHVFWGIAIFLLTIATALMGIFEKNHFSNKGYSDKNEEGMLTNTLGLILIALALLVVYILTNGNYRRPPNPDEETHLQLDK